MMPTFIERSPDDDDKYAKAKKIVTFSGTKKHVASPGLLSKYHEAYLVVCSACQQVAGLLGRGFLGYLCYVVLCGVAFQYFGGRFEQLSTPAAIRCVSTMAESLGLIVLRQKVVSQASVAGISARTIKVYAYVYFIRQVALCPPIKAESLIDWVVEWLSIPSIIMVFATLRSFKTYRSTYQEELDVLPARYLIPFCTVMGVLVHPDVKMGPVLDTLWTVCFYSDILALMPQVVMMVQGNGKVEAPISHFVAATAFSRFVDLTFWYHAVNLVGYWVVVLIIGLHLVSLAIIADFMYYYLKARFSGSSPLEDLEVNTCDMC